MTTPILKIIHDGAQSAHFNMAADLYLMNRAFETKNIYLRIYHWEHPTITLGFMQTPEKILNLDLVKKDGIHWVMRPTGGRGVFHNNDVTYSIIFPISEHSMGQTIEESGEIISQCLTEGLKRNNIFVERHDSELNHEALKRNIKLPCFLAPNRDEIMVNGRKLIGSAQKRTKHAVLQHGSIPVSKEFINLPKYEKVDLEEQQKLTRLLSMKSISLEELSSGTFDKVMFGEKLIEGFSEVLPFPCEKMEWSEEDYGHIEEISKKVKAG